MTTERIAQLQSEHDELVFDSFDNSDAWRLGNLITASAIAAGHRVAIDIRRPGMVLFRAALEGTTPDQEAWIAAKAQTVFRMESSGALLAERFGAAAIDPAAMGWLPFPDYAVTGGSVPVRVKGVGVVAAVTASGLSSDDDHAIVVAGIREFLGLS